MKKTLKYFGISLLIILILMIVGSWVDRLDSSINDLEWEVEKLVWEIEELKG